MALRYKIADIRPIKLPKFVVILLLHNNNE